LKAHKKTEKRRPKNVWNSVRKLEGYLRKADIQAIAFMESLRELRDSVTVEVKSNIVRELCRSVNGDILHELLEHKKEVEHGNLGNSIEQNAVLSGIFDTLTDVLDLSPVKAPGERFSVSKETAKGYVFEEYPEAMDDENLEHFRVEVLRCGWRVGGKLVVKPTVFEACVEKADHYEEPDLPANIMSTTSDGGGGQQ
jgi:hypothetical protein